MAAPDIPPTDTVSLLVAGAAALPRPHRVLNCGSASSRLEGCTQVLLGSGALPAHCCIATVTATMDQPPEARGRADRTCRSCGQEPAGNRRKGCTRTASIDAPSHLGL